MVNGTRLPVCLEKVIGIHGWLCTIAIIGRASPAEKRRYHRF